MGARDKDDPSSDPGPRMSSSALHLAIVATFAGLPPETIAILEQRLQPVAVPRGTAIVTEGEAADRLYVVIAGRFTVHVAGNPQPVTEISRGATIGEIAMFAGGTRTATVRAIRDSVVVALDRADFDDISAATPAIWNAITAALADRLAAETRRANRLSMMPGQVARATSRPRTIAMIAAGGGDLAPGFRSTFCEAARRHTATLVVCSATIGDFVDSASDPALEGAATLNELEARFETIVYITDPMMTPWTETSIRQADEILLVANAADQPIVGPIHLSPIETFARSLHRPAAHRLVIAHARSHVVQGTRHWLQNRDCAQHHHTAHASLPDIERLWRFLRDEAVGYVACGGGAYTAAHIGIYKACREAGIVFDYLGGASGGAAMAAAFADDIPPDELEDRVHRMFIDGRALSRYTIPRYGLLDHTHFDKHLKSEYDGRLIEDMWKPYFAVAVDLGDTSLAVMRHGPAWEAIRASAAIPGLLPPFYTSDGRTLVDGAVISNVPLETMHNLKRGPNIVVAFEPPHRAREVIPYDALPAGSALLWRMINPFSRNELPNAPSATTILVRSMMANRGHYEHYVQPADWLLVPPTPDNMGALDWRRHREVTDLAYRYCAGLISFRRQNRELGAF